MGFLAPWFAVALSALAVPVLLHLVRRMPRSRVHFSTLMFLTPSPPRLVRRSRLEHWWLLLLRLTALTLIAMAFMRPFWRQRSEIPGPLEKRARTVLLLDVSASMRRTGLWANATHIVQQVIDNLSAKEQLALWTFDEELHPVADFYFGSQRELLLHELQRLSPSWSASDVGRALVTAIERLQQDETGDRTTRIVLITDLQEGSRLDALRTVHWPRDVQLLVRQVVPDSGQASLQLLPPTPDFPHTRFRVRNDRSAQQELLTVRWFREQNGQRVPVGPPQSIYVPPGQSRLVTLPVPPAKADGVELFGDKDPFANWVYIAPIVEQTVRVLFWGNDSADDPQGLLFYLAKGLIETPGRRIQLEQRRAGDPLPESMDAYRLAIVADSLPFEQWQYLATWVENGRFLLLVCREAEQVRTFANAFSLELQAEEGTVTDYLLWSEIDFAHRLFVALDDPRYRDFTKIHFWKYRRIQPPPKLRTVVRFDNDDPALLEYPVGSGSVLLLSSGWQPSDSQWAVSTKWVPFLEGCLSWAGCALPVPLVATVGKPLPWIEDLSADASVWIQEPEGIERGYSAEQFRKFTPQTPGLFRVRHGQQQYWVGVNLDATELRTDPMDPSVFDQLGVRAGHAPDQARLEVEARQARDQELERQQRLWRWLLAGAFGLLVLETWLAARCIPRAASSHHGPSGSLPDLHATASG